MKKLNIFYQTNRSTMEDAIYYPEDEKTPEQRVEYVIALSKEENKETINLVSACPYVIEGFSKLFRDREVKYFIDNIEAGEDDVFTKLAEPMKKLTFID